VKTKKPKLLVLTSTFPRWKDDTDPPFVYELSKRLTSSFDVTVHAPHYPGALVREQMGGVQVHRFRYFFPPFEKLAGGQGIVPKLRRNILYFFLLPFFLFFQLVSLVILISKQRPNIIHAHWLIPQGLCAIIAKKIFKIPVIITAHGADVYGLRSPLLKKVKKWIVRNANHVVPVSSALAELLLADTRSYKKMGVISMGVDGCMFSPDKNSSDIRRKYKIQGPFLLYVGRLSEKKGVSYLIDAMPLITSDYPAAKLLIIGHGELEQELREQVRMQGLGSVVRFVGGVTNSQLPVYYATADIFIGPSVQVKGGDTEGFGLTFVEAMMSGCLTIGARVGGVEDVIRDGQTGFLVPAGDSQSLARKIIQILKKMGAYKFMRVNARQFVTERFDWAVITRKYSELFWDYVRK